MIVLAHQNRDVCPTCPTLRETSREKPTTSTTTTGRTIVERFSGRDQLPHQQRQGARPRRPPPRSRGRRGGKQHWGLQYYNIRRGSQPSRPRRPRDSRRGAGSRVDCRAGELPRATDIYETGSGARRPDPSGPASTVTTGCYVRTTSGDTAGVYKCSRNPTARTPSPPSAAALSGRVGSSFRGTTTSSTATATAVATTRPLPATAPPTTAGSAESLL